MISKSELKYIQSLYHKKTRDKENVFIVEGPKMVAELLESNLETLKVWTVNDSWLEKYPKSPITVIDELSLAKASHLTTPNEVLAMARIPASKQPPSTSDRLFLALDGIRDPGNMGTLIRIADWFGVDAILSAPDSVDIFNPKVVQASMGSIFRMPVFFTELPSFLKTAMDRVPIYGALLDGAPLGTFPLPLPMNQGIIVIGNESTGIRQQVLPFITQAVKIPAFGQAESLNAAVAAAVLLGHIKIPRQAL